MPEMARKRARAAIDLEDEPVLPVKSNRHADPIESLMEEVINPLLDKISLHGKDSLTEDEKLALERASREVHRHRQG
jgi:hypothetical protein